MSSLLNVLRENAREASTQDTNFLKQLLYYFELILPAQATAVLGGGNSFIFPLVINPESYSLSEPFAVEPTMTQGAGVYVEENGIITRTIRLRGQTGWKPRRLQRQATQLLALHPPKSYSRSLPAFQLDLISGHRHFMYLQDAVFRTYADYKRDPSTAAQTKLLFHNPKDSEHWVVIPRAFNLERTSGQPNTYRYDIDLLVVDRAESVRAIFSEDKKMFSDLKDALRSVQAAINLASGALNDLSALTGELKGVVKDFVKIIDSVTTVVRAATAFVSGVTSLIQAPFALVTSTAELIESSLNFYATLVDAGKQIANIPDTTRQSLRQLGDALDKFGLHPESFETPAAKQIRSVKQSQQISRANSPTALAAAAAKPAPPSFAAVNALGTSLLPGDAARARAQTLVGADVIVYTGSQQYAVAKGDTLVNLAARFLGDARLWQYLAVINGLKPPFVDSQASASLAAQTDETALAGAVGLGTHILIPNFSQPPESQPLLPVLGVTPDQPADVHLLGADLLVAPRGKSNPADTTLIGNSRDLLDLVLDAERGGSDVKTVRGVPNLGQALTTRMITERGTDTLYQSVGAEPVVSLNLAAVDVETARFRLQETLTADSRVAGVQAINLDQDPDNVDQVVLDITVSVRGFSQPTSIKVGT